MHFIQGFGYEVSFFLSLIYRLTYKFTWSFKTLRLDFKVSLDCGGREGQPGDTEGTHVSILGRLNQKLLLVLF